MKCQMKLKEKKNVHFLKNFFNFSTKNKNNYQLKRLIFKYTPFKYIFEIVIKLNKNQKQ